MKILADGTLPAGTHSLIWDGRDSAGNAVASGVYFSRLEAGGRIASKKMLLIR